MQNTVESRYKHRLGTGKSGAYIEGYCPLNPSVGVSKLGAYIEEVFISRVGCTIKSKLK